MQSIRGWLEENPEVAADVMARNASYVFFEELKARVRWAPKGVALTPGTLAGRGPEALVPGCAGLARGTARRDARRSPLRRLLIAQDTGGAIRGSSAATSSGATAPRPPRSPGG